MEVTTHRGAGPLQQVIEIGPHRILTDGPVMRAARRAGRSRTTCWQLPWQPVPP